VAEVRAELFEDGTVLRILVDAPKGNVLTRELMTAMRRELEAHSADPHLKLVAIQGAGGTFSFGASVEEHRAASAPAMLEEFHGLLRAIASYPKPVAALVEGKCLGGGFELALAAHFVLATQDAVFGCPEIKLAVFPPVLAAIGHLRLGGALAERLLLTGALIDVQQAQAAGWLTAAVQGDAWSSLLSWYRATLAPLSARALRTATGALRESNGVIAALGAPLSALERRYASDVLRSRDGIEGIEAFLARRPPIWEDA
jgi:cyclohexa-1,5-dienecarbonyl-CoA hydratase